MLASAEPVRHGPRQRPGRRWYQRSREQQTSRGMTKAGRLSPQVPRTRAGGGRHLGCSRTSSLSRAGVGGGPTGPIELRLEGPARWLPARGGRVPYGRSSWSVPGQEECQRATGGVRTKQVGVNPLWRADVEAGVEGPSGFCRPLSCGYPAGAALSGEALLATRWLAIAGVAGSDGSWSCSWITEIAEVDERHVAPELR
jgi:hypothetical protein